MKTKKQPTTEAQELKAVKTEKPKGLKKVSAATYKAGEELKEAQAKIYAAQQAEFKAINEEVNTFLQGLGQKGYALSARMILEAGKAPSPELIIVRTQQ